MRRDHLPRLVFPIETMPVSNGDGGCVAAVGDDFKFAARRATGSGGGFVGGAGVGDHFQFAACSVTAPAASARWRW
ncbi:unnamed protein product [Urochloa humidicola]